MLKKFVYLFFILSIFLSAGLVSASISIPGHVSSGHYYNIEVNFGSYYGYAYFYNLNSNSTEPYRLLYMNCGQTCNGDYSLKYDFPNFDVGDYEMKIYSYDNNKWISSGFSVVEPCDDGTEVMQCSTDYLGKFCNEESNLVDDCQSCGCSKGYKCSLSNNCELNLAIGPNEKDMNLYSDKMVFLMSDRDWIETLPFVSVATWTGEESCNNGYETAQNVCTYPTLIYHDEENGRFDADSIIDFMNQFDADSIVLVGDSPFSLDGLLTASRDFGAGVDSENIARIHNGDYLLYWNSLDTLVYVEQDYEKALIASTYASLKNAPLIIQGSYSDSPSIFSGRNVICVGDVSPSSGECTESYNLEELQNKYKQETGTDKIILINPSDWSIGTEEYFFPDKGSYFRNLYVKTSLVAPILASAKHELILSTTDTDYLKIDEFLKSELLGMDYLTIIASTYVIPHKKDRDTISGNVLGYDFGWSLDSGYYADITGNHYPNVAVGRIAGISSSDVSSYTARSLFYNSFLKTNNVRFMASSFSGILAGYVSGAVNIFSQAGYNVEKSTTAVEAFQFPFVDWENQDLIFYVDHGNYNWAGIYSNMIPNLDNSLIFTAACLTVSTYESDSFWARAIRKGAIGYIGATSTTALNLNYFELLNKIYGHGGSTIGDAFKDSYKPTDMEAMTTLIGDPTFDINPSNTLKEEVSDDVCIIKDYPCVFNDWCCNGLECSWFTCSDCKSEGSSCLFHDDCCGGLYCDWFKCNDCKSDGNMCLLDGECCSDRCSFFECKACDTDGESCILDGECCDNNCKMLECGLRSDGESCVFNSDCISNDCNMFECGKRSNGEGCLLDSDCISDRCSLFQCKSCNTDGLCLVDRDCCGDCKFDTTSIANYCCWGKWYEPWKCGLSSSHCGTWTAYGPLSHCRV